MSKLPYMPLAVDAYLADTTHLTLEEHGAYLILLMCMWRREGAIPDNDRMTARMLGVMPRSWHRLKPRLMPLLQKYGPEGAEMLTQSRLQREWNYSVAKHLQQSEKGRRGAKEKWERYQILNASRGNDQGNGRTLAPNKVSKNLTTYQEDRGAEKVEGLEDNRLLQTPLMRRTQP